jgi:hypothetical protein
LLKEAPPEILRYIIAQYAKVLPTDVNARKTFVAEDGLRRIQELNAEPVLFLFFIVCVFTYLLVDVIIP